MHREESSVGLNDFQVIVAVFKCVVGVGSFFLPYAVKQAGLYGGTIGIILLVGITIYLNNIIFDSKNKVFPKGSTSYVDLTREVYGKFSARLMYWSIVVGSVGACAIYLVTCGELIKAVFPRMSITTCIIFLAICENFICWLPSFHYLTYTSLIGNICLILAMITVVIYGIQKSDIQQSLKSYPGFVFDTIPEFFALVGFLFVQPPTFFPIANAMKNPHNFNRASNLAYTIIAVVNITFGVLLYLFFGSKTKDIVLKNLCDKDVCENIFVNVAQMALVFDIFFTFPVVLACATDVMEDSFFGHSSTIKHTEKMGLRSTVMGIIVALALLVPNITDLVNLTSGVSTTFSAFFMGPLIYLKVFYKEHRNWRLILMLNIGIIILGVFLGVWATYLGLLATIEHWKRL